MKQVTVKAFGGPENLQLETIETPMPGVGQVLVRLTSVGLNHADLMARRGEYKLISGDPPFTPGLEGGGVIEATGSEVEDRQIGQRVVLSPAIGRRQGMHGAYRTHYVVDADDALPAPDNIPNEQLGSLWLAYLTAWGCLVWKQKIGKGTVVAIPAASSSVGLAAAQVAKKHGATTIGLTRSEGKAQRIAQLPKAGFDHLVVTHEDDGTMRPWHRQIKELTSERGVEVFFDPVAAGPYLSSEIKALAADGTVWIYGLLGDVGQVDVTPLVHKRAAIRGWMLEQLVEAGRDEWGLGCKHILDSFADGSYQQHVDAIFALEDVGKAHETMERGEHVGKLVLEP